MWINQEVPVDPDDEIYRHNMEEEMSAVEINKFRVDVEESAQNISSRLYEM